MVLSATTVSRCGLFVYVCFLLLSLALSWPLSRWLEGRFTMLTVNGRVCCRYLQPSNMHLSIQGTFVLNSTISIPLMYLFIGSQLHLKYGGIFAFVNWVGIL